MLAIRCSFKRTTQEFGWYEWLAFFIPFFGWIRTYQWKSWLYVSEAAIKDSSFIT